MALLLGLIVWGTALMMAIFMGHSNFQMPEGISTVAPEIDGQYRGTLVVVAIAFLAAQALLGWFIIRYRDRGEGSVRYLHGNNAVEFGAMAITGLVFVFLGVKAQFTWARVHLEAAPEDAIRIEALPQQFAWNFRYPGDDGTFGATSPDLYNDTLNPIGIDPEDPASADDVWTINEIAVPVNRPVQVILRSKDVIHDFYVPQLRLKQDALPGLTVPLQFTATKTGDYRVLCAELCGLGHYRMKATLKVLSDADYRAWLREQG